MNVPHTFHPQGNLMEHSEFPFGHEGIQVDGDGSPATIRSAQLSRRSARSFGRAAHSPRRTAHPSYAERVLRLPSPPPSPSRGDHRREPHNEPIRCPPPRTHRHASRL